MFHIARAYNGLAEINCPAKFAGTHQTSFVETSNWYEIFWCCRGNFDLIYGMM